MNARNSNIPPVVGVVMSVRNGQSTVARAIASITAQEFADWRLVLIDDGSTDGTLEILNACAAADSRVWLIRHSHTRGLAASLNEGIACCDAPLIARMDADDESLPGRFTLQVRKLQSHPEIDVLGSSVLVVDSSGNVLDTWHRAEDHATLCRRIWVSNPFFHPSVMFHRSWFYEHGGYDEKMLRSQDYDLWLRSYRTSVFANLGVPLIRYRAASRATLRNVYYSSLSIWRAVLREEYLPQGLWHVARPWLSWIKVRVTSALRFSAEDCSH